MPTTRARHRCRVAGGLAAAACLATPLSAQSSPNLNLGANSRGYVAINQLFTPGCTVGPFAGGPAWAAGNRTINCSGTGWTGTSIMSASARSISSYTSVAVTGPSGLDLSRYPNNGTSGSLIALSRAVYLDQMTIGAGGVVPDSVRFSFHLSGTTTTVAGANTVVTPTATFAMGWDTQVAPVSAQGVVMPTNDYTFAFAVTPSQIGRAVYFSTALMTFANMFAPDVRLPINGSAVTDFSHTLDLVQLQFLAVSGSGGAGIDVTRRVQATFASGETYLLATPEPTSVALVAAGLAMLGAASRRRTS